MNEQKYELTQITKEFKELLKKIKENNVIVVYRHILPDYDALGTQMGLVTWIKDNFPSKEVHYVGEGHPTFIPNLVPEMEVLDEKWYEEHKGEYLAIVVDTATLKRSSEYHEGTAKLTIKIDHHPAVENYGDINIVHEHFVAASELLTLFALSRPKKYKLSPEAARYFYIGLVGDSGRFQYPDTDGMTLRLAGGLIDVGLNITEIYNSMYVSTWRTLNFQKFVLNNYKLSKKGVCYYVVSAEDQKKLGITLNEGKLHVNTFRNVEGVDICMSITEDVADNKWRVSLRSAHTRISQVAEKYHGGGHDFASGCEIKTLDEIPALVADLEAAIGA